jgi:DNA-binding MurR/RpiR family transcriptional regulator
MGQPPEPSAGPEPQDPSGLATDGEVTARPLPPAPRHGGEPAVLPAALTIPEKIRQGLSELSPSERRVARTLLGGPPTIGLESSPRLARRAGVSSPTVSRFVAGLGFGSYREFQRALQQEIAARITPAQASGGSKARSRPPGGLGTGAQALAEAVTASVAGLDPEQFDRAVRMLADGRRQVLVTGGWFSQLLAGYLASVLHELRPGVRLVAASANERAGAIADIGRRDTVAVFDFRRYERDTLEVARAAHAARARVLLFTDPLLSPVADIADAVLTAHGSVSSSPLSLTPALAVVEVLLTSVADALGEAGRARFERYAALAELWGRPGPHGADSTPRDGTPGGIPGASPA